MMETMKTIEELEAAKIAAWNAACQRRNVDVELNEIYERAEREYEYALVNEQAQNKIITE